MSQLWKRLFTGSWACLPSASGCLSLGPMPWQHLPLQRELCLATEPSRFLPRAPCCIDFISLWANYLCRVYCMCLCAGLCRLLRPGMCRWRPCVLDKKS